MASPLDDLNNMFGSTPMGNFPLMAPFGVGREQSPAQLGASQAMLTLANMPDTGYRPQGVGEGIQQVAQGIAGAQMQRAQLNMMRYMLPMQMMQQKIALAKQLAPQAIPTKYGIGLFNPLAAPGQQFQPGIGIAQLETGTTGPGAPLGDDVSERFFKEAQDEQDPVVKSAITGVANDIKAIPDPIEQHKAGISAMESIARLRATRQQQEWMHQVQGPLDAARTKFYNALSGKTGAQISVMRQSFINEWGQDPFSGAAVDPSQMAPGSVVAGNGQGVGAKVARNVTPTGPMRNMAEYAQTIDNHIPALVRDIQSLAAKNKLGPIRGRLNDLLVGTYGAGDPDFAQLRADLGFLHTGTMKAHVGARGAVDIMKHFESLFGTFQDAPTLIAGLTATHGWMQNYMKQGSVKTNVGTYTGGQPMGSPNPLLPPQGQGNPQDDLVNQLLQQHAPQR